ncbi:MAG: hypothetical protein U0353_32040 [Sandaracinus sp.]
MQKVLLVVGAITLAGCGGGDAIDAALPATDSGGGIDAPGLDAPAPTDAGPASSTTISAATGGTASSLDGLFEIIIAPGALAEDTDIVITRVADADVPSDIAATEPLSAVYAVEPDGLVFGGDGAVVHYHFDTTPTELVAGGRFAAGFAVSRPREGGAAQWQSSPSTAIHEGHADVFAPLAHLSYQWAVAHDDHRNDYFLAADFDDPHTARVGDRWSPRIDVQATVELASASVRRRVASDSALDIEGSRGGLPDDLDRLNEIFFGAGSVPRGTTTDIGTPPLAADRPHDAGVAPRFFCATSGEGHMVVSATFLPTGAPVFGEVSVFVSDPEPTTCIERTGPEISILDTIPGVRDGTTITSRDPAALEAEVEARTADTHTAVLAGSPWFATFDRPGGAPSPGPDTITATNGGATMTATRDPVTGSYTSLVDDPAIWDGDAITRVVIDAASADVMPAPRIGLPFGPVDGLDTMVHGSDDGELELRVRFPGTLRCMADDVTDLVLFRRLDGSAVAVPLREGLLLAATYCGRTIEELTGLPFVVEVTSVERAQLATSSGVVFVSVGHGLRVDGTAFTTVCTPGLTYCFDRCVNTTTDPLNCGGCGEVPLEVCDMLDNDCDGGVDEGCPGTIFTYSSDDELSPHFGDTTRPAGSNNTVTCPRAITGLCGSTNSDGSIRQILAICGVPTLRRITTTTPYTFAIDVTDSSPGTCLGGLTGGGWTGGAATYEIHCPPNMVAEGFSGEATTTIQSLRLHCTEWVPTQDATGTWVIRNGATMASPLAGSGAGGSTFSWIAPVEPVDMNPAVLRNLRNRYFAPSGGISDVLDLWGSARASELRP